MFIFFQKTKRLCGIILLAVCTVILSCTVSVQSETPGLHEREDEMCFFWREDRNGLEGRRIFCLYASPDFAEMVGDRAMAMILPFSVGEGGNIRRAVFMGVGEMTVTVGEDCMLLDGFLYLPEGGAQEMLELVRLEMEESGLKADFEWNVGDTLPVYVRGRDGQISVEEVLYCDGSCIFPYTEETAEDTHNDPSETDPPEMTTETEERDTVPIPSDEGDVASSVYFGCQETSVQNGLYAVRLLCTGDVHPFIVVEGGGVLQASVTRPETVDVWEGGRRTELPPPEGGAWLAYTFRGLLPDRVYCFYVRTRNGVYRIRYDSGEYIETVRENE